jgi:hypothetical protein
MSLLPLLLSATHLLTLQLLITRLLFWLHGYSLLRCRISFLAPLFFQHFSHHCKRHLRVRSLCSALLRHLPLLLLLHWLLGLLVPVLHWLLRLLHLILLLLLQRLLRLLVPVPVLHWLLRLRHLMLLLLLVPLMRIPRMPLMLVPLMHFPLLLLVLLVPRITLLFNHLLHRLFLSWSFRVIALIALHHSALFY